MFAGVHWRGLVIVLGPVVAGLILLPPALPWKWCAFSLVLMAIYWVSECIPLPVTSFLPMITFPMNNIMTTSEVCNCYISDAIMMFLGSLVLACAVEQSGFHVRLALSAVKFIGYSHFKLLFSMCFITMFISMWITNTAAVTMMIPICFALLKVYEAQKFIKIYEKNSLGEEECSDIGSCYFCALTFSATIGGIGTLVGTATNLAFKGLYQRAYPEEPEHLSFPKFSAFAVPYMLVMEIGTFLYLASVYFGMFRPNSDAAKKAVITPAGIAAAKKAVDEDKKKLGKITYWEVCVVILFSLAILMFFCRSPQIFQGWGDMFEEYYEYNVPNKKLVSDSSTAMFVGFLMLLLPSTLNLCKNFTAKFQDELPKKAIPSVLLWKPMNDSMPYSFMFLLGGGFALSTAAKKDFTDLNGKIGEALQVLESLPPLAILGIIILLTEFLTNFASNVAICYVIAPIMMNLAEKTGVCPLWYCIAAGFVASYCFLLPVGTPGNLVVQSACKVPTARMVKAGIGSTVVSLFASFVFLAFWAPIIWPNI